MIRAMMALMRLEYRKMLGGWKILWLGFLTLLPLLGMGIAHGVLGENDRLLNLAIGMFMNYPNGICVLTALLYGSSIISTELENKTLSYLFTRPIPKWLVLIGKYVGFCVCLCALVAISVSLTFLAVGKPKGGTWLLSYIKVSAIAIFAYGAIFTLVGLVFPRRAIIAGLVVALVEFITALIPSVAKEFTVTHYLRALLWNDLKEFFGFQSRSALGMDFVRSMNEVARWEAYLTLGLIIAIALTLACFLLHRRELNVTEKV